MFLEKIKALLKGDIQGFYFIEKINKGKFPFFKKQYKKNPEMFTIGNVKHTLQLDENNKPVSYIIYRNNDEYFNKCFNIKAIYIIALEVDKRKQGKGYFRKMMETFLSNHPYYPIIVRPYNESLIPLYSKFGFKKFKETKYMIFKNN